MDVMATLDATMVRLHDATRSITLSQLVSPGDHTATSSEVMWTARAIIDLTLSEDEEVIDVTEDDEGTKRKPQAAGGTASTENAASPRAGPEAKSPPRTGGHV
jgi:hypothetical protein